MTTTDLLNSITTESTTTVISGGFTVPAVKYTSELLPACSTVLAVGNADIKLAARKLLGKYSGILAVANRAEWRQWLVVTEPVEAELLA